MTTRRTAPPHSMRRLPAPQSPPTALTPLRPPPRLFLLLALVAACPSPCPHAPPLPSPQSLAPPPPPPLPRPLRLHPRPRLELRPGRPPPPRPTRAVEVCSASCPPRSLSPHTRVLRALVLVVWVSPPLLLLLLLRLLCSALRVAPVVVLSLLAAPCTHPRGPLFLPAASVSAPPTPPIPPTPPTPRCPPAPPRPRPPAPLRG